jgi:hypothetical protein
VLEDSRSSLASSVATNIEKARSARKGKGKDAGQDLSKVSVQGLGPDALGHVQVRAAGVSWGLGQ